jgi:hypothetical protein
LAEFFVWEWYFPGWRRIRAFGVAVGDFFHPLDDGDGFGSRLLWHGR